MSLFQRGLLDCDPFGVIPIKSSSPPFICALFGHDVPQPDLSFMSSVASCCSPYYAAMATTGNGCDIHYCGLPAYEAIDTVTSTKVVVTQLPTAPSALLTTTYTSTYTYDVIEGYPKVSSCLSSAMLWARGQYGIACRVGGSVGSVGMTGPATIVATQAQATPARTTSASATTGTRPQNFAAGKEIPWVHILAVTLLMMGV